MRNLLSDACAAHQIAYSFTDENLDASLKLSLEERRNIYLIYKEALYNALKYSNSNHIEVELHSIQSRFTMRLRDNGIGLSQQASSGNGLHNMKHRAAEMNANIHFDHKQGLTITLILL
jgi:signal transduction histidine kinase